MYRKYTCLPGLATHRWRGYLLSDLIGEFSFRPCGSPAVHWRLTNGSLAAHRRHHRTLHVAIHSPLLTSPSYPRCEQLARIPGNPPDPPGQPPELIRSCPSFIHHITGANATASMSRQCRINDRSTPRQRHFSFIRHMTADNLRSMPCRRQINVRSMSDQRHFRFIRHTAYSSPHLTSDQVQRRRRGCRQRRRF